ncbi:MAG: hypothetical protein WA771_01765 [Chthoniobacterales bacterium]
MSRALFGILTATAAANVTAVLLGILCSGLGPVTAWISLIAGLGAGGVTVWQTSGSAPPSARPSRTEWFVIIAFVLACLRAFLWLIYQKNGRWFVLSPYNLGDLSLHLGLINYLASGVPFWPDSLILIGDTLRYPIGADLFNSLLLLAGLPAVQGLVLVGFTGAIITGCALWLWGRGFAIAALLFSGGLAAFLLLGGENGWKPQDFQAAAEWPWKNFFLTMLITQRGLLFALPTGLLLLADWRARWLTKTPTAALPTWAAVLLYATMPLTNVHTFLFLSFVLLGIYLLAPLTTDRQATRKFVVISVLPATVTLALVTGLFSAGGGVHWQPGWLQDEEPVWFWIRNFGLVPFLWIATLLVAVVRRDRRALAILAPATAFFLVCCFVSFAPWPWDNVKLMLWCWLAAVPFVWQFILRPLPLIARAPILFVLFFSGAISLLGGLDGRHGYSLIPRADLDRAASALRQLPPTARVAVSPDYNHPVLIAGQPVVTGYEGHLWSHGLDYRDKSDALDDLMNKRRGWREQAKSLGVDYLYWGKPERQAYGYNQSKWRSDLPIVVQGEGFTIYDLREPAQE